MIQYAISLSPRRHKAGKESTSCQLLLSTQGRSAGPYTQKHTRKRRGVRVLAKRQRSERIHPLTASQRYLWSAGRSRAAAHQSKRKTRRESRKIAQVQKAKVQKSHTRDCWRFLPQCLTRSLPRPRPNQPSSQHQSNITSRSNQSRCCGVNSRAPDPTFALCLALSLTRPKPLVSRVSSLHLPSASLIQPSNQDTHRATARWRRFACTSLHARRLSQSHPSYRELPQTK